MKRMREKIIGIFKSSNKKKKYMAIVKGVDFGEAGRRAVDSSSQRVLHFGASDYEQYKDRTPLKLYSSQNHYDKKRQMNYYSRHSKGIKNRKHAIEYEIEKSNGYYNSKILSHIFLW